MNENPYDPGPKELNVLPSIQDRGSRQFGAWSRVAVRTSIAVVVLAAFIAWAYPRSAYVMDINPLAGPLNYLVWSEPRDVANGAMGATFCLATFLSLAIRPRWYTFLLALAGAIIWLAYVRFFLILVVF